MHNMGQTKKQSITEAAVNILAGLLISFAIQLVIYPLLNIPVTINQNITLTTVFFVSGFFRSYFVRRIFNKYQNA